jgi:predicted GH43/DUF377 family glycosyl hydrolase
MRAVIPWLICLICMGAAAQATPANTSGGWMLGPFARLGDGPVLQPRANSVFPDPLSGKPVAWEALHTFNPAATVLDGKIAVLYRAEDSSGQMMVGGHTSRLGLATSSDGVHFDRRAAPVLYPTRDTQAYYEAPGGVEDPRLVQREDGSYIVTYTQYARDRSTYTIGIATSNDLVHWTKQGQAFAGTRYAELQCKSAGILTEKRGDRVRAVKLQGKYWMYWGEIEIRLATSADLIHWVPVEDRPGHPEILLSARPGRFDSGFPETGPPPLLTSAGIVMIYNAKNAEGAQGDPGLAPGTYSAGEALFSRDDPAKILARTDQPFFRPERTYERTGQYAAGTTFAEGLVWFKGEWFLYYGAADSYVGVAAWRPGK